MKKYTKKILIPTIAALVIGVSGLNSSMAFGLGLNSEITLPTVESAYKNNNAQKTISAGAEESRVKPWVYANVKLESVRTNEDKLNYGALALNRALAYFEENNKHFKSNDYFIILNNGFIINHKNFKDKEVFDQAKKALLETDLYQGDTIFTIAFLSGENTVVNTNMWKLIDMVNLGAGSKYTYTSTFNVGVSSTDTLAISETIGETTSMKLGGSIGFKALGADISLIPEINEQINQSLSRSFTSSQEVSAQKNQTITIQHGSSKPMTILRYQLVNNINVNLDKFGKITKDLNDYMNMGGRKIVDIEPSGGNKGIDVPTNIIYDVVVEK